MISRLEIKGFKSLADVSIELGAVNVFIGANGSGKSNLLEAVGMQGAIASGNIEEESLRYRGVRGGSPESYISSLKNLIQTPISLSASADSIDYRTSVVPNSENPTKWDLIREEIQFDSMPIIDRKLDGILVYKQPEGYYAKLPYNPAAKSDTRTSVSLSSLGMQTAYDGRFVMHTVRDKEATERRSKQIISFLDDLASFAIYAPSTSQLRGLSDDIHRDPIGLGGWGLSRSIEEMKAVDPEMLGPFDLYDVYELIEWADEFGTVPASSRDGIGTRVRLRFNDRFMEVGHKSVTALEASEGALYVLFLLALTGHSRSPRIFGVDNFDQALHPRLACALTRLVSEQIVDDGSRQMLATTHNPLVLDGLDILDDRIRLFTVDRDSTGATQVKRVLVSPELMALADKGLSLSRLWVMGRLGGVPKYL